jgi:hypothetical protein
MSRAAAVFYMFLVLLIGLANFAIGFALAVQMGHGPSWANVLQQIHPAAVKTPVKAAPAKSAEARSKH